MTGTKMRAVALRLSLLTGCAGLLSCATTQDTRGWERVPGLAQDIAVGGSTAWVVEKQLGNVNCSCVSRYNGNTWERVPFPRTANRIAVDLMGNPWVATTAGEIYKFDGVAFQLFPGPTPFPKAAARDIAVGKGTVWLVGREMIGNTGFTIHRYSGNAWTTVPGSAISVAANAKGDVWIIDVSGAYQFNGTSFIRRFDTPPQTVDIGVSDEGVVWIATRLNTYLWNGFVLVGRGLPSSRVTGGPNRTAWVSAASDMSIYRWAGPLVIGEQAK